MVVDFKLILLLQLCVLIQNANTSYYDRSEPDEESQSQEDSPEMKHRHLHHRTNRHEKSRSIIRAPSFQLLPMPQLPLSMQQSQPQQPYMNSMSIPQMQMVQQQQMSQMQMPQMPMQQMPMQQMSMQQMPMSSIPQMSMPGMSMPSMPMSMMQMPGMRMPMQMQNSYSSPYSGSYQNQNLMYYPMSSQFSNYLKNMLVKPNSPVEVPQSSPVLRVMTTAPLTTMRMTTISSRTTTLAPIVTTNKQKSNSKPTLKQERDEINLLQKVLKNAIGDFTGIIVKTPEKNSKGNNKYMLTSLRRTKPTWMPKFGIVPIPDNMAHKLMSRMREMKEIKHRVKRQSLLFHSK